MVWPGVWFYLQIKEIALKNAQNRRKWRFEMNDIRAHAPENIPRGNLNKDLNKDLN